MADIYAVFWALGFLGLGLGLAWLTKHKWGLGGITSIVLILAPVVLFLVLTGRVAEFGGGGVSAKFRAAADERLTATFPLVDVASGIDEHGEPVTGGQAMAFLGGGAQVVFLDAADAPSSEADIERTVNSLATKIYFSLLKKSFLGLLVTDGDEIIGYFQRHMFYDLLRIELIQNIRGDREDYQRDRLNEQLRQTMLWDIVMHPKERLKDWGSDKTLHAYNTTNLEALRIFLANKVEVMPLVDNQHRFVGMVTWEDLVSTVLVSASSEKASPADDAENKH